MLESFHLLLPTVRKNSFETFIFNLLGKIKAFMPLLQLRTTSNFNDRRDTMKH